MRSHPGVAASFFACIGEAGGNIEMISTSEIPGLGGLARQRSRHRRPPPCTNQFELGGTEQAVVYAGTGR